MRLGARGRKTALALGLAVLAGGLGVWSEALAGAAEDQRFTLRGAWLQAGWSYRRTDGSIGTAHVFAGQNVREGQEQGPLAGFSSLEFSPSTGAAASTWGHSRITAASLRVDRRLRNASLNTQIAGEFKAFDPQAGGDWTSAPVVAHVRTNLVRAGSVATQRDQVTLNTLAIQSTWTASGPSVTLARGAGEVRLTGDVPERFRTLIPANTGVTAGDYGSARSGEALVFSRWQALDRAGK